MSQPATPPSAPDGPRLGRMAMAVMVLAFGLVVITALLGPSAAVVPLPPGGFPLGGSARPSPWLVTALLAGAVAASAGATAVAWLALRRGWAPSPARLLAAALIGIGVLVIVPPVAGADVLSYAAYGHIAGRGGDPYTVRPDSLPNDPFTQAVEDPWRSTPSVYGPLATLEQRAVVGIAGDNLRLAVGLLDLVNGIAFAAAGWLLFLLAGPDAGGDASGKDGRRRWAVLSFVLNPVLVLAVVAESHIDALVALILVGALALWRRSAWWAGVAAGAGVLIKLTAGLPLAGWGWLAARSRPGGWNRAARLVAGAGVVVVAGYATTGLHGLQQARRASRFVSVGTPWRPLRSAVQALAGHQAATLVVSVGATAVTIWLAVTLARNLPDLDDPGGPGDPGGPAAAARAGLVLALAWTLAAPYVLGWYDAVPWALLALLPFSRFHKILLVHTAMLTLAYLPGRVVALPHVLSMAMTVLRSGVSPAVLAGLLVLALRPARGGRSDPPFTGLPQHAARH